jgi:hypothetical protein
MDFQRNIKTIGRKHNPITKLEKMNHIMAMTSQRTKFQAIHACTIILSMLYILHDGDIV